jgi:hypothetical protein
MPGALVQLVATGIQDEKLTQDPEITFFKAAYRPYINFALESIEQTFTGTAGFGKRVQCEVARNGDLVKDAVLEVTLPAVSMTGVAGTASAQTITVTQATAATDAGALTLFYQGEFVAAIPSGTVIGAVASVVAGFAALPIPLTVTAAISAFNLGAVGASVLTVTFAEVGVRTAISAISSLNTGTSGVEPTVVVAGTLGTAAGAFAWSPSIGYHLIKNVAIEIGGQTIDKHYGQWYNIWTELTCPSEKRRGFNEMIGQQNPTEVAGTNYPVTGTTALSYQYDGLQTFKTAHASTKLYVPLKFWFNCNPGLALPIIALQYHQIKVIVEFRAVSECYALSGSSTTTSNVVFTPSDLTVSLWLDYVFLDNAERRNYAQIPHEYLITQLQHTGAEALTGSTPKVRLSFNHPVRELVWAVQEDYVMSAPSGTLLPAQQNQHDNYSVADAAASLVGSNPVTSAKLMINAQDRFAERSGSYFNLVQPHNHHSNIPVAVGGRARGIQVYSFALNPEEYQPNGSLNASRIDTMVLNLTLANISSSKPGKIYIFATNVNQFRIASGMGGLAYAN